MQSSANCRAGESHRIQQTLKADSNTDSGGRKLRGQTSDLCHNHIIISFRLQYMIRDHPFNIIMHWMTWYGSRNERWDHKDAITKATNHQFIVPGSCIFVTVCSYTMYWLILPMKLSITAVERKKISIACIGNIHIFK